MLVNQYTQKLFSLTDTTIWQPTGINNNIKHAMIFSESEQVYSDLVYKIGAAIGWDKTNTNWLVYTGKSLNKIILENSYQAAVIFGIDIEIENPKFINLPKLEVIYSNQAEKKRAWVQLQQSFSS